MSYHSPSHRSDGLSLVVEEEGLGEEYVVPGSFPWSSSPASSLVSPSLTSSSSHTLPPGPPTPSMGSSGTVSLAAEGPSLATLPDSLSEQREQLTVLSDSQATTNRMLDRIRHGGEVPHDITEIREHLHTIETRLEILLNRQREVEKESITDRRHESTSDWATRAEVESVSESSASTDLESLRRRWSDLARGARIHAPAAQPAEPFSEFLGIPSPLGITGVQSPPPIMPFVCQSSERSRSTSSVIPGRSTSAPPFRDTGISSPETLHHPPSQHTGKRPPFAPRAERHQPPGAGPVPCCPLRPEHVMSDQPAEDERHPHVQPADPLSLQDDGPIRPPAAPASLGLADGPQASCSWYQQHPPDGVSVLPLQASTAPPVAVVSPSHPRGWASGRPGFIPPSPLSSEVRPRSPYRYYPVEHDEGFIPRTPSPRSETHPVTVQPTGPTVRVPPTRSRSSRTDTQETYHPVLRSPASSPVPLDDQHPEQLGPSHTPTPPAPKNVGQTPAMPPLGRIHPSHQEPMVAREPYPTGASMDHSAVPPTIPIGGTPPLIPMRGVPPSGPIVIQPAAPMQVPQPAIPSHPPSRADLRSPHEHGMTEMPASPRRTHPTPQPEHSTQLPAEPPVIVPGSPSTYSPRVVTLPVETYDYDSDEYYYPSRRQYYYDDDEYYYPRRRRRQRSPYYDDECNHFRCRYRHPDSDSDEDPHDPRRLHGRQPPTEEADVPYPPQLGEPQMSPGERDTATPPATQGVPRTPAPLEPPVIDHGSPSTYVPQVLVLPEGTDDYDSDDYYYPRHRRHYYGPCRRRRYYDNGDYDYPRHHPHYYDDDDDYYYPRWRRRRRLPYYDDDYVYRPRRLHRRSDSDTDEDHDEGTQRPKCPAVAEDEPRPLREEREAEPHEPERRQPNPEDSHRGRPNGCATYSHGPGDRDYDGRCPSPSFQCVEKHRKGDTRTPRRYRAHSPTQPTIIRSDGKHNDGLHRPVNVSRSPQSPRLYTDRPVSPRNQYVRHLRRVPPGEPAIPRLRTDMGERHPHYPATPVPGSVVEPRDVHVHDYRRTSSRGGPPPSTIVQRDEGHPSSGTAPHVPAPPMPEHGMPAPEDAQLADVLRERHGRLNDTERELAQTVHEAHDAEGRRDDEFRSNEEARQQIFLDSEARRDAEARQRSDTLFRELEEKVASVLPIPDPPPCDADQHSIIESIRTATHDAASRHAADVLEIVRMERELLEKEREANAAERERARAELGAERQRLDETRKARIRELEEDLSRVRAELGNERQLRLREADGARSAAAQRDAARDGQIQELLGIVTRIAEEQNAAKQREEDARQANEGKPGIEQVLEDLARQNAEQRELLNALSETWRTDNQRQHEESIDTIRAAANEQVPYNVREYLDEFSKALAVDVRMLLGEVGKLREERRAIQHEVGLLMLMRAKYVPGGEFHGDWQPPPMGGGPPPGAPSQPPPDMPVPEEPRQPIRTCWRPVSIRPTRRIRKRRPAQPPQAEAHISPPRHTQSWETWHHEPQPRLLMDRRQTMGGSPTPDASPWQYDYRRTPSRGSPPTIVERDGGCSPSEIARDFSAPPMPEHGMPGPEAHDTEERPKDEFRSSGEARQQILLDSEARRDAEARQESGALFHELEETVTNVPSIRVPPPRDADEDSLIETISTAASHVASRHSGDAWEIVRGEPELLEEEREANAAKREHAHAARIHELAEGLNRVLAELDSERQLRTTESDEARSAAAEPDEALRNQSAKITNLVQQNCEENMAASEDIWGEKKYWKTERDGQIQELPDIVTKTAASAKQREVNTGQANEGQPDIEQVIDDLARQTAEQRELLNALAETWRKDNQRQHEELINTIRATANEQVPCNLQGYLAEFNQAILGEVGELREERRAIQHELGLLLMMRAKYSPGGEFYGDWQAMGGDPTPDAPPQPQAAGGSTVNHRTTRGIQKQSSVQPPEAEPEISLSRHTQSWATWHPNPSFAPTPPSVKPRLLVPDCQSPGSPEPWRTTDSGPSSGALLQSWATWLPNPAIAPTPPPVEPTLVVTDRQSPGLFGPRSPRGCFR